MCPGSEHNFYLSVSAGGTGASKFLKPCDSVEGCGGLQCSAIPGFLDNAHPDDDIRKHLERLFLFDTVTDNPTCAQSGGTVDVVREAKSFISQRFYNGEAAQSSTPTLCGADLLKVHTVEGWFPDCKTWQGRISCQGLAAWDGVLPTGGPCSRQHGSLATFSRPSSFDLRSPLQVATFFMLLFL